ncbi:MULTISPECIES: MFS transporter [Streptomyces]|uniref:Multidrug resistance protein MdtH n=1 Tax=Streptomyces chartreusis NRRL 3882 TaxID=1079985 RepID=A0A2N9B229_STRCX|nr:MULTISPECIES: MFS transporter [Streptomyces]MYS92349.1 MFS transporter [Streptomyces sp. SID5464]SOR77391.1 Multidrug resistance protein MdtH [Streptomyces chartreusis NRRL 3882]
MVENEAPAPAGTADPSVRSVGATIVLDYLFSHLGYFTLLPVLPVLIPELHPGVGAWWVGAALLMLTFALRGGALFVSGYLHRTPTRRAMITGLLLAAVGFGALPVAPGVPGLLLCLVLAGLGISINGLTARAYVVMALPSAGDRTTIFSGIQVAVNISAALGPIAANFLFADGHYGLLVASVAVLYTAAALAVLFSVPGGLRLSDGASRPPLRLGLLKVIVADRQIRRVAVVTAVGSLLYAQLFSALALQIADLTTRPALRAAFFTVNAVLVVALQIPVTVYMRRGMDRGEPAMRYLLMGLLAFSCAFAALGVNGGSLVVAFAAVVVFTFGETLFTPTVSTAFADFGGERPVVEVLNLRQVATAVGESAGSFVGGTFFLLAAAHGVQAGFWYALAATGVLTALLIRKGTR